MMMLSRVITLAISVTSIVNGEETSNIQTTFEPSREISNDINIYAIEFSGFNMKLSIIDSELGSAFEKIIISLTEKEIDSDLLHKYSTSRSYYDATYEYLDNLAMEGSRWNSTSGSTILLFGGGNAYFNLPYGARPPSSEELNTVISNAVTGKGLLNLIHQVGLKELESVQEISILLSKSEPENDMTVPILKDEIPIMEDEISSSESSIIASSTESSPESSSTGKWLIIMPLACAVMLFALFLIVYKRRKISSLTKKNIHEKDLENDLKDTSYSYNSSFVLSESASIDNMASELSTASVAKKMNTPTNKIKSFPIILRKDMLCPTDANEREQGKVTFLDKIASRRRRNEEYGHTVLESSHFTASDIVGGGRAGDTVSVGSSMGFDPDTSWDPNDVSLEKDEDGNDTETDEPFLETMDNRYSFSSTVRNGLVRLTGRCEDDSVVL